MTIQEEGRLIVRHVGDIEIHWRVPAPRPKPAASNPDSVPSVGEYQSPPRNNRFHRPVNYEALDRIAAEKLREGPPAPPVVVDENLQRLAARRLKHER